MLIRNKTNMSSTTAEQNDTGLIWDMHTHLMCLTRDQYKNADYEIRMNLAYEELNCRRSQNIAAFFSCGTPQEWEFMKAAVSYLASDEKMNQEQGIYLSFGIHPWYSDQYDPKDYRVCYKQCDAVGEIGMDNVWCMIPLERQRKIFEMQLQIAADLGKPVVLHTKGQEHEIAEMIRDFPGKICVHWYSGDIRLLEQYLQKDCYFTLGPDFSWNEDGELYQFMVRNIPEDRLFLETDGLDAVIWAYEESKKKYNLQRKNTDREYVLLGDIMYGNLQTLSMKKKKKPKEMQIQLQCNLFDFLSKQI